MLFGADGRIFLLRSRNGLVDFGRDLGPHLLQTISIQELLVENQLLGALERILSERLAPNVVGHVARIIMFSVAGETQSRRDHELRWPASPRALDGGADDFE